MRGQALAGAASGQEETPIMGIVQQKRRRMLPSWIAIVRWGMAATALLAVGCGGQNAAVPGGHVYVDIQKLAESRPEWGDVREIDRRIARLQEVVRSAPLPPPSVPEGSVVAVTPPGTPSLPPPGKRGHIREDIAAATPSQAQIRTALEKEALPDEGFFRRSEEQKLGIAAQQKKVQVSDEFAASRRTILERYENQVINLRLKEAVLQNWLAASELTSYSTALAKQAYARTQAQLATVQGSLNALLAQQDHELAASDEELRTKLDEIDRSYVSDIQSAMTQYRTKTKETIDSELVRIARDMEQEAAQRRLLFQKTFDNPLSPKLVQLDERRAVAAPLMPSTTPANVIQSSAAAQIAALGLERKRLASQILQDTQSWVHGVADRNNMNIQFNPQPGRRNATERFAVWLRDLQAGPGSKQPLAS